MIWHSVWKFVGGAKRKVLETFHRIGLPDLQNAGLSFSEVIKIQDHISWFWRISRKKDLTFHAWTGKLYEASVLQNKRKMFGWSIADKMSKIRNICMHTPLNILQRFYWKMAYSNITICLQTINVSGMKNMFSGRFYFKSRNIFAICDEIRKMQKFFNKNVGCRKRKMKNT